MRNKDALNLLEIQSTNVTESDVKKAYRASCKKYHPDVNPAGLVMMQAINEAYEQLMKQIFPISEEADTNNTKYAEELNAAISKVINIQNINIEVCGSWVWLSGETKMNKDTIKEAGFLYASKKKMWYYRPEQEKKRYYGKPLTIDEIRVKHGSNVPRPQNKPKFTLNAPL